jgi:hypothetical protein
MLSETSSSLPPYDRHLQQFVMSREQLNEIKNVRAEVNSDGVTTRVKREKKERTPRPSKEGMVTIQQICAELKIEPSDARAALRKGKFEKPGAGWSWKPDDPELKKIRDYVKANAKKEVIIFGVLDHRALFLGDDRRLICRR